MPIHVPDPDDTLVEQIEALAAGIPFVVSELARRAAHEPDWVRLVEVNMIAILPGQGIKKQAISAPAPKSPFHSVRDIIDEAKRNPGKLTNSSSASGSPGHIAGELFKVIALEKATGETAPLAGFARGDKTDTL